jgi:hypothetical protein
MGSFVVGSSSSLLAGDAAGSSRYSRSRSWALGVSWLGLALLATTQARRLVRLVAFLLIIAAIVDKNRSTRAVHRDAPPSRRPPSSPPSGDRTAAA